MICPKPANPYDARISGTHLLACPDGRSAFKVYFLDIVGRQNPERYEWDRGPLSGTASSPPCRGQPRGWDSSPPSPT